MIINSFIIGNGYDADAWAFITAASISNTTQRSAINTLVISLKQNGLWVNMKAIYPFVGGTATTHKFNLKNPLDTDAAFRLTFSGGWTHSATGAKGNGTNGWANTFLAPSTSLSLNSGHISYYSRVQVQQTSDTVMGSATGVGSENIIAMAISRQTTNTSTGLYPSQSAGSVSTLINASAIGLFTTTRTGSAASTLKIFRNATAGTAATLNGAGILSTNTMAVNCLNYAAGQTSYSSKEVAFASIGSGLSDTDASNLYTIVQAFQTALSRNV